MEISHLWSSMLWISRSSSRSWASSRATTAMIFPHCFSFFGRSPHTHSVRVPSYLHHVWAPHSSLVQWMLSCCITSTVVAMAASRRSTVEKEAEEKNESSRSRNWVFMLSSPLSLKIFLLTFYVLCFTFSFFSLYSLASPSSAPLLSLSLALAGYVIS